MNAKEMFEQARVKFIKDDGNLIIYSDYGVLIRFNRRFKLVEYVVSVPTDEYDSVEYDCEIDVLQAITQQMKELGWIE